MNPWLLMGSFCSFGDHRSTHLSFKSGIKHLACPQESILLTLAQVPKVLHKFGFRV